MKNSGKIALMVGTLLALLTPVTSLGDTLILKNGDRHEGYVKVESDDYIFFVIQIGDYSAPPKMFSKIDIKELMRVTTAETVVDAAHIPAAKLPGTLQPAVIPDGAVKVAFVTLGDQKANQDMVGSYINGDAIKQSTELLLKLPEAQRPEVVVLIVDSGGGAVSAIEGIMESIDEMKEDFRVVGWIKSAISGAAFTAMNFEEMYFMTAGHLGGNVAYSTNSSGKATAMKGRGLNWILDVGEKVSRHGRLDPAIMRSMQILGELTADIDEVGNVTWYWRGDEDKNFDDLPRGKNMVSRRDNILTFNSVDSLRYKVSQGTADTKDELARLLGADEWVEVGAVGDEHQLEHRAATARAEERINIELNKFGIAMEYAKKSRDVQERGAKVGQARRHLRTAKRLVKKVPWWFETQRGYDDDWFREQERLLDDIAKS